jgi:hypothetical protein
MKTAVIFHPDDAMPEYIILNGDYTKFNGLWFNEWSENDEEHEAKQQLAELIYCPGINPVSLSQFEDEIRDGAKLITCGTKM